MESKIFDNVRGMINVIRTNQNYKDGKKEITRDPRLASNINTDMVFKNSPSSTSKQFEVIHLDADDPIDKELYSKNPSTLFNHKIPSSTLNVKTALAEKVLNPVSIKDRVRTRMKAFIENYAHKRHSFCKTEKLLMSETDESELYAVMPPLESFMGVNPESRRNEFYQYVMKDDIIIGRITEKVDAGLTILLLCFEGKRREIFDLNIRAFCPQNFAQQIEYDIKDIVRAVIVNFVKDASKIIVSMKDDALPKEKKSVFKLGLLNEDDLPSHYLRKIQMPSLSYHDMLQKTLAFNNPGTTPYLCSSLQLPVRLSLLQQFHNISYDTKEMATGLRKTQNSKWAFQSVKSGIDYLKKGNTVEAFQMLNKALQIDPEHTEALVARGALFANNNNFKQALKDFEKALEINPNHHNGRKYLSETIVALGKEYQEKGDLTNAEKMFKRAIQINSLNTSAKESLKSVQKSLETPKKENSRQKIDSERSGSKERLKKNETILKKESTDELHDTKTKLQRLLGEESKIKKPPRKKKKRRYSSSESESSSESSSEESSSSSSSSEESSSSSSSKHTRRHKRKKSKKSKRSKYRSKNSNKKRDLTRKSDNLPKICFMVKKTEENKRLSAPSGEFSRDSSLSESPKLRERQSKRAKSPLSSNRFDRERRSRSRQSDTPSLQQSFSRRSRSHSRSPYLGDARKRSKSRSSSRSWSSTKSSTFKSKSPHGYRNYQRLLSPRSKFYEEKKYYSSSRYRSFERDRRSEIEERARKIEAQIAKRENKV